MSIKLIITTANSIIGVSILAMPFCFSKCGILLAPLMIIACSLLVKLCCHLLVKSASLSHSPTYEFLASHTFGSTGKFVIEVSMIGFMMGTCVAFYVVIGDLAPPIVANITGLEENDKLRLWLLVLVGVCCVLPLSLLRHLDSLSYICSTSMVFYTFLVVYISYDAIKNCLFSTYWLDNVVLWRPAGVFQCLPIFCMGLSCQPQVFEVRKAMKEQSSSGSSMNRIVGNAVNLCSTYYILVGFFGYILFYNKDLGGNILTSYSPTVLTESIKIVFGVSVAVSFPLVVFPCRTAIHSLCFKNPGYNTPLDLSSASYIPPNRSNAITLAIVLITLIIGIMIPDIEFVLGLVGSTIGNVVCILLPSVIFVRLNQRNTTERLAAQGIFFVGLVLMVVGTYVNLHMADSTTKVLGKDKVELPLENNIVVDSPPLIKVPVDAAVNEKPNVAADPALVKLDKNQARVEPVEPHAPKEVELEPVKDVPEVKENNEEKENPPPTDLKAEKEKEAELKAKEEKADKLLKELEKQKEEHKQIIEEQKEVLDRMKQHLEADETQDQEKLASNQNNLVPAPQQNEVAGVQGQQPNLQQQANVQKDGNLQEVQQQPQPNVPPLQQFQAPVGRAPVGQPQQFQAPVGQQQQFQAPVGQQQQFQAPVGQQQQFQAPVGQPQQFQAPVGQGGQVPQVHPNPHQNAPQHPQQQQNSPNQQVFQQQQKADQHLNLPLDKESQPFGQNANYQNGVQAPLARGQEQVNLPSQQIGQQKQEVNLRAPQLKNNQGQVDPGFKALPPSMNQRPLQQQPQKQGQPESIQVINKSSENHKDFKRESQEKVGRDLKHFTNF